VAWSTLTGRAGGKKKKGGPTKKLPRQKEKRGKDCTASRGVRRGKERKDPGYKTHLGSLPWRREGEKKKKVDRPLRQLKEKRKGGGGGVAKFDPRGGGGKREGNSGFLLHEPRNTGRRRGREPGRLRPPVFEGEKKRGGEKIGDLDSLQEGGGGKKGGEGPSVLRTTWKGKRLASS